MPSASADKSYIESSVSGQFLIVLEALFTQASSKSDYFFKLAWKAFKQQGFPLAQKSFDLFMTSLS